VKVLITDGASRAALAATRSLGAAGHQVFVGNHSHPCLAGTSRWSHQIVEYPDPSISIAEFLASVLTLVRRYEIDFLLPITDVTLLAIAERQHEFEDECALPFQDGQALLLAADKSHVVELSESLGIPVPNTSVVHYDDDLDDLDDLALQFPVVIKPARSRVRRENSWLSTSVSYADNPEELRNKIAALPAHTYPVLLQQKITGRGLGLFACANRGNIVAFTSHLRVREKPPSGGVSVVSQSAHAPTDALKYAQLLLRALDWTGVAMVEFKLDDRNHVPYIMEINGRFWGSLQLAISSGVNFPEILARMCTEGSVPESQPVSRAGLHNRWLWGDVDALLLSLFNNSERQKLKATGIGRAQSIRDFFRFRSEQSLEVFRTDDIRPWLHETGRWFTGR